METFQIEATIEKFSQDNVQLKGAGKYLFEKSSENDEKKKYLNILEAKDNPEESKLREKVSIIIPPKKIEMQHLLGYAFAEKKRLKFELKENGENYTIIEVSHAST
ncbi:MAG: hypothetical protein LBC87_12715 [Fibromonadaceae bacterium]|nr:hypothetical protein [Fibromonadaceae bacterium]